MKPPLLKSNTSGPVNSANTLVWRAWASNVWLSKSNADLGNRKNGVPGANGLRVLYRKSATTAPPRTSLKSPSPVVTVRFLPRTSTFLASSSSVGGLASAGGEVTPGTGVGQGGTAAGAGRAAGGDAGPGTRGAGGVAGAG